MNLIDVAQAGFQCTWTDADIDTVETLTKVDWSLARGPSWFSTTTLRAPSARALAARLVREAYWVQQQYGTPLAVREGLGRIFSLFGWEAVPLSSTQIEYALTLAHRHVTLLEATEATPKNGILSIPHMAVIAQRTGTSFRELSQQIVELAPFGLQGPSDNATYLGLTWEVLSNAVAGTTSMHPTGNQ